MQGESPVKWSKAKASVARLDPKCSRRRTGHPQKKSNYTSF